MLKWFVYRYNVNSKEIELVDIFKHGGFRRDFVEAARKYKDETIHNKLKFAEEVRRSLQYYFWSRCEWEVLIYPWPCHPDSDRPLKIDVYKQVLNNWDAFVEYVWPQRSNVKI